MWNLHFCIQDPTFSSLAISSIAFSGPAFSTPAFWSRIFRSCIFYLCIFGPAFPFSAPPKSNDKSRPNTLQLNRNIYCNKLVSKVSNKLLFWKLASSCNCNYFFIQKLATKSNSPTHSHSLYCNSLSPRAAKSDEHTLWTTRIDNRLLAVDIMRASSAASSSLTNDKQ